MRQSVAAVDPMLPIAKMESMADVQAASLAQQRFMMSLVVGLGVVALLLAAIGIHGLIASSVSERTRELGIRLALGATGRQVVKDVVMPGVILAAAGVAIGGAAALAVVRLLQSFLWGVDPDRPADLRAGRRLRFWSSRSPQASSPRCASCASIPRSTLRAE